MTLLAALSLVVENPLSRRAAADLIKNTVEVGQILESGGKRSAGDCVLAGCEQSTCILDPMLVHPRHERRSGRLPKKL